LREAQSDSAGHCSRHLNRTARHKTEVGRLLEMYIGRILSEVTTMHIWLSEQTRLYELVVLCALLWTLESVVPLYRYGLDGFDDAGRQSLRGLLTMPFVKFE
jgi:hypothetical protein